MAPDDSAVGRHRRRRAITLILTSGFLAAEVVGGLVTGSLALLADAGHMLTDVGALAALEPWSRWCPIGLRNQSCDGPTRIAKLGAS